MGCGRGNSSIYRPETCSRGRVVRVLVRYYVARVLVCEETRVDEARVRVRVLVLR